MQDVCTSNVTHKDARVIFSLGARVVYPITRSLTVLQVHRGKPIHRLVCKCPGAGATSTPPQQQQFPSGQVQPQNSTLPPLPPLPPPQQQQQQQQPTVPQPGAPQGNSAAFEAAVVNSVRVCSTKTIPEGERKFIPSEQPMPNFGKVSTKICKTKDGSDLTTPKVPLTELIDIKTEAGTKRLRVMYDTGCGVSCISTKAGEGMKWVDNRWILTHGADGAVMHDGPADIREFAVTYNGKPHPLEMPELPNFSGADEIAIEVPENLREIMGSDNIEVGGTIHILMGMDKYHLFPIDTNIVPYTGDEPLLQIFKSRLTGNMMFGGDSGKRGRYLDWARDPDVVENNIAKVKIRMNRMSVEMMSDKTMERLDQMFSEQLTVENVTEEKSMSHKDSVRQMQEVVNYHSLDYLPDEQRWQPTYIYDLELLSELETNDCL